MFVQVFVYLVEIVKVEKRGSLVIIQQFVIEFGILIMYFIGYVCVSILGMVSFWMVWGMQFIFCVFFIIGLFFLFWFFRWLVKVGRDEEVIWMLVNIQVDGNIEDLRVIVEWEEIVIVMNVEREVGKGWRKFFKNGMWKRIMVGMMVQVWQ